MALDQFGNYLVTLPDEKAGIGTGGSPGSGQIVYGAFDDPNGNVTPPNTSKAAIYYKDQSNPVIVYIWSESGQVWIPAIS